MPILSENVVAPRAHTDTKVKAEAIGRVIALFAFVLIIGSFFAARAFGFFGGGSSINQISVADTNGTVTYKAPYNTTLDANLGIIQEPRISLPLKTSSGYKDTTFLLDSGAVISTLPLQTAKDIGINLAAAKRITLQGFSGVPTFAYLDTITVKIADKDYNFPATFSETNKKTYILGRQGLFDTFTVNFDHVNKVITLTRKGGS